MVDVVHPAGSGFTGDWTAWAVSVNVAVPPWKGLPTVLGKSGVTVQVTAGLVSVNVSVGVDPVYQAARSFAAVQHRNPGGQVPPVVPAPVGTVKA